MNPASSHSRRSNGMLVAMPLRIFETMFRPFIWLINGMSNMLLRAVGISTADSHGEVADALLLQELGMGAAFLNLPVLDDQNFITVNDGLQPVGDNQGRA